MRISVLALLVAACSSPAKPPATPEPAPPAPAPAPSAPQPPAPAPAETVTADTPRTTTAGNSFTVPAGWSIAVRGDATILATPEGDSRIALIDVGAAADADAALKAAWAAYQPGATWKLQLATEGPPKDGWTDRHQYGYDVPPNAKRIVRASTQRANGVWTVIIFDVAEAVAEKRYGQLSTIFSHWLPKGGERESFAGRTAKQLDGAELAAFAERARTLANVPGVALGVVQHGKLVLARGFGVRELGKPAKVDEATLFMIGSNTKALTTLLLAKLVDAKKLAWDTQVTSVMPAFKLGDEPTTKSVQIKHLICACTGLPRQDLEWIFQFQGVTPANVVTALGGMQPTSKFGEMFQYSNLLAAVAGYVAGSVANPKLELGAAYDRAMQTMVFDPLAMKATTFDYARALRGNVARPHALAITGEQTATTMDLNNSIVPVRPAGAAWSNVIDMLKYVAMELAEGELPGGKRYLAKDVLLARRAPQVSIGKDVTYGMGLSIDNTYGTPVVHHGGATFGYLSDMLWLPEHGVGAVILTNGDMGEVVHTAIRRKLLELLFDGKPEAEASLAAAVKNRLDAIAVARKELVVPPDPAAVGKLAGKYRNAALGEITVRKTGTAVAFDAGEWKTDVATRKNADGTISFVTIGPGFVGQDFVVGTAAGKPTLIVRDAQHEYVFEAL